MKNLELARRGLSPAVLAALLAAPAMAQDPVTPTPTLSLGSPCRATVTLSWDVSSIPDANGVLWELDGDPGFANPTGAEPGRLARGTSNSTVGSVVIDLRDFGKVLDGTRYHLRVVAKDGGTDVARRSDAVVFDLDRSPEGTYSAVRIPDQDRIGLLWDTLDPEIRACSDRIFWEVKEGSGFTSQTADPDRFDSGDAPVPTNEAVIDVGDRAPGDFHVRLVGKHAGLDPGSDVGRRGAGVEVTIPADVATPRPPSYRPSAPGPTTPPPSAYRITSFTLGPDGAPAGTVVEGEIAFRFTWEGPTPERYRVGECGQFGTSGSAEWRPWSPTLKPTVSLGSGPRTACLQIAATSPKGEEVVSEVASRSVDVLRENTAELRLFRLLLSTDRDRNADYAFQKEKIEARPIDRGEPTHVRFGECDGIQSEAWQPWNPKAPTTTSFSTTGVKELCMQLKSEPSGTAAKLSGIRSREIEIFGPLVTRVITDEASNGLIQGYAVINGFTMSKSAWYGNESSGCNIVLVDDPQGVSSPGLAVHPGGSVYTMCKFTLFSGRVLNPPWTVESVSIPGTECLRTTLVRKPRQGSRSLHTTVEAKVLGRKCADQYGLPLRTDITLTGPAGADWREAFREK